MDNGSIITRHKLEVLGGQEDWITSAQWLTDDKSLMTSSRSGVVRVWTGPGYDTVMSEFNAHDEGIFATAVSSDGDFYITSSEDQSVHVYKSSSNELIQKISFDFAINVIAVTNDDSRLLVAGYNGSAVLVSIADGAVVHAFPQMGRADIWGIAIIEEPRKRYSLFRSARVSTTYTYTGFTGPKRIALQLPSIIV